jgi:hypothetical protein
MSEHWVIGSRNVFFTACEFVKVVKAQQVLKISLNFALSCL